MIRRLTAGGAFLLALLGTASAGDPSGEWRVANGAARIGIDICSGRLWGVVAWEAQPGTDTYNPDPAKRSRPTLGLPILLDMTAVNADKWQGHVYNAENGKIYSARVELTGPDELRIDGCLLRNFLCMGEKWKRTVRFEGPSAGAPVNADPGRRPQSPPQQVSTVCAAVAAAGASGPSH